jgi:ubiquitin-like 1-activating enzyme E1 A
MLTEEEIKLYDRQIRLWGVDAQKRMRETKILLIGFKAIHSEVCKNLVLAGIYSITILEWEKVTWKDLGAHIFLEEKHIGKNRGSASLKNISLLNPLVSINCDECTIESKDENYFKQFNVICVTNCTLDILLKIDNICRKYNIFFFISESFGSFSYFFEDLNIYKFSKKILQNNQKCSNNLSSIIYKEEIITFPSLNDVISVKWKLIPKAPKLFFGILCLYQYQKIYHSFPHSNNQNDLNNFLQISKELFIEQQLDVNFLNETFLKNICQNASCEISPVCSIIGGILGQEIIKIISANDEPINQFFFYNSIDSKQLGIQFNLPINK